MATPYSSVWRPQSGCIRWRISPNLVYSTCFLQTFHVFFDKSTLKLVAADRFTNFYGTKHE